MKSVRNSLASCQHDDPRRVVSPTRSSPQLRAALGYVDRGMAVFPLLVGRKEPKWRGWEDRATRSPEQVSRSWGRAPLNVGVACGPSGLVVVDLDVPKPGVETPPLWAERGIGDGMGVLRALADEAGEPWPETLTVVTPRGGLHLYFVAPAGTELGNSAGTVAWSVDVRGHGGYVVGLGSVVDGRPYTLAADSTASPAPLPGWLLALVARPVKTAPRPASSGDTAALVSRLTATSRSKSAAERWVDGALAAECEAVASTPPGEGRNNRLNRAAFKLGQLVGAGRLDELRARQALAEAATLAGLEEYETERTIGSGLAAGMKSPRSAA